MDKFIRFQKKLQEEILKLEFQRYDLTPDGKLREVSRKRKLTSNKDRYKDIYEGMIWILSKLKRISRPRIHNFYRSCLARN